MKTQPHSGFTLIEVIAIIVIVAILVAVLFPYLNRAKQRAQRISCTSCLKQVGLGARQWSMDHGNAFPARISVTNGGVMELIESGYVASWFLVASNELNTPKVLWCPSARPYRAASTFTNGLGNSNVNYFVGLDADETQPQLFLTGDDNLIINGQPARPGIVTLQTNTPLAWSTSRHDKRGNVSLSDGSVQGFSDSKLQEAHYNSSTNAIRLAFP